MSNYLVLTTYQDDSKHYRLSDNLNGVLSAQFKHVEIINITDLTTQQVMALIPDNTPALTPHVANKYHANLLRFIELVQQAKDTDSLTPQDAKALKDYRLAAIGSLIIANPALVAAIQATIADLAITDTTKD